MDIVLGTALVEDNELQTGFLLDEPDLGFSLVFCSLEALLHCNTWNKINHISSEHLLIQSSGIP